MNTMLAAALGLVPFAGILAPLTWMARTARGA